MEDKIPNKDKFIYSSSRTLRLSATPRFTFQNPGLSNVKLHKVFVPDHNKKREIVFLKKTVKDTETQNPTSTSQITKDTNQANLQIGSGTKEVNDALDFPVKIGQAVLKRKGSNLEEVQPAKVEKKRKR